MADKSPNIFKGFDDWVDIFAAGDQTDSAGNERTFSTDDLDEMVANHSTEHPAPVVVGHPKDNEPAHGWTGGGLRRQGKKLQAKFTQLSNDFVKAVEEGRFRNRSVAIAKDKSGKWFLRHVGFLGASLPAVPGLKPINFSVDDDAEFSEFEFAMADTRTPSLIGWALQSVREFLIDKHSISIADKILPKFMIDEAESIRRDAEAENRRDAEQRRKEREQAEAATSSPEPYSKHKDEDTTVTVKKQGGGDATFTQADIDAAVEAEREKHQAAKDKELAEAKFEARLAKEKTFVDGLVNDAKMLPTQAEGMAEFLAGLPDDEGSQFEFSSGEGAKAKTKKVSPAEYIRGHFSALPAKFAELMKSQGDQEVGDDAAAPKFRAPQGHVADPDRLKIHQAAIEYQQANDGVSYYDAVKHVSQGA